MSRITQFAIAKRSVILLLAAALFFAGIGAWGSLKQELLPDIQLPILTVIAPLPGAGAADVAEEVTRPLERAIVNVPHLKSINSASANSIGIVVAQFDFGTDVKEAQATIEQNVAAATLPTGVTPQISALNINQAPVVVAAIAGDGQDGLNKAAEYARTRILPEIQGIDGVASAQLTGGLEQRVIVTLDPAKMAQAKVTLTAVTGILKANSITIPGGQITSDTVNIPVSTIGSITTVDQIRNLVVGLKMPTTPATAGQATSPAASASPAGPTPILLSDLATIEETGVATTGYARYDGNPALTLTVSKTSTANTVSVADAVTAKLSELSAASTGVATVTVASDLSTFIKDSRDGLLREGGLGALFAVLTIFLFLFSLRSTLVAAVSIPLSVLSALVAMQITGVSINIMTLGGLAVAVGRVVDDSIVVLENIYRHRALGENRSQAVLNGPREVAAAITSATATTVAVFLPIGFVGGLVSQFFLPFALTVTFALLASLVIALTVVPVLAFFLMGRVKLNVDEDGEPKNSLWLRIYTPAIRFALRSRATKWGVLAATAVLFVGSLALAPLLPTQFINAGSENVLTVTVAPAAGTSSAAVRERAVKAEGLLRADPKVEHVATSVPGEGETGLSTLISAFTGRPANSATLTVRLAADVDLTAYTRHLTEVLAPIRTDGFDATVGQSGGFSSNAISVVVSGANSTDVAKASDVIVAALKGRPDLLNVKSDLSKGTPEVQVRVDPAKAMGFGLTAAQVGGDVRNALAGQSTIRIQTDPTRDPMDVFVRIDPSRASDVASLSELPVGTAVAVPLASIATVEQVSAQGSITRVDGSPAARIGADITSEDTGAVSADVQKTVDDLTASGAIPQGVTVTMGGVTQQQAEAFGGLFVAMGVAILLVYLAMVLTFNSLITPFVILLSLPLATIGAFPALLLTNRAIGVSSLIGFLMLIGIVVTNAIVMLDLVEQLRARGMSTKEALIEGGRTRVRPILMTAIATILALIPLAAGLSQGSIIAAELGTVVIGGLFSSTFLTLLVIPIVYSLVDGGKAAIARRLRPSDDEDIVVTQAVS